MSQAVFLVSWNETLTAWECDATGSGPVLSVLAGHLDDVVSGLGRQGWEIISVVPHQFESFSGPPPGELTSARVADTHVRVYAIFAKHDD